MTRRRWWAAGLVVLLVIVAVAVTVTVRRSPAIAVTSQRVAATAEPDGTAVTLDTSLYLPATTPAPAVLLAHGFGATKNSLDGQARDLARHGFVVLTYSARGFGASGGSIHLDALKYEVADASKLVDYLQARPEVQKRAGRPVIGVAGSSYGGALALMLGATDHRIDAVAADITWNDLSTALFPNDAAGTSGQPGVFKKLWAGYLFSAGFSATAAPGSPVSSGGSASPGSAAAATQCGRFSADVCALYQRVAGGGELDAASHALLLQSSPSTVLSGMTAPTLLIQGEQDSLFGLEQADANATQLTAAGGGLQVRWRGGGHDATDSSDDVDGWERSFLTDHLAAAGGAAATGSTKTVLFDVTERDSGLSASTGRTVDTKLRVDSGYPSAAAVAAGTTPHQTVMIAGLPQTISAPAGGSPAAVSSIPGLGGVLGAAAAVGSTAITGLSGLPGQTALFSSERLPESVLITGSSQVRLLVRSTSDIVLFASMHDVAADGTDTLPNRLVAPFRLPASPSGTVVQLNLPSVVYRVASGHRLVVVVSATDFAYSRPAAPATYTVALAPSSGAGAGGVGAVAGSLIVPSLVTHSVGSSAALPWLITAAVVLLVCVIVLLWQRHRRRAADFDADLAQTPVVVSDLVKQYGDGYRAVNGVSFTVERGQVLGLLGPNGAGKTTTLRVLMGLILPTTGTVRVFGAEVVPGSPALARLGAFVEGPGLLPHLSGRENLELYWASSGRPREAAQFDTVLEIAGLGASLERRVKSYSHGMQQRLAIAQAMLGLPEVLVLDEPTNGLDPPQIAEMREVLHAYAATGRTVIVSSHLLAEVEQTCTHVVVMHRGRLVAAGSVAEVAGSATSQLAVDDPSRAVEVLAAAGVSAELVPARRALEDVFLDLIGERDD